MESKRFDDLSRAIASMSSRRSVLRGIVGGAIASVASGIGLRGAEAARTKRGFGDICRKPDDCESGVCTPDGTGRSRCACESGSVACFGECCQTYCDELYGCADPYVDIACYEQCESIYCFGTNNHFNYTYNYNFNSQPDCQRFCVQSCSLG